MFESISIVRGGQVRGWLVTLALLSALIQTVRAQSALIISEIMYHPPSTNLLEQWIELHNPGIAPADLTGWKITKGPTFAFPPGAVVPPGGYLIVAAEATAFTRAHPGITNVVAGWSGALSRDGEEIRLEDARGNTVDSVLYAPEGDWATRRIGAPDQYGRQGWEWFAGHDGLGQSLELINPALPNDFGHNWTASQITGGTPGRANSSASTNIAPMILDVAHFPVVPRPADTVTITARLLDERANGLTAWLSWRPDGATNFTTEAMFDDGAHGDGLPNDGLFAARLPGQTNGVIVEYYLTATDADGNSRVHPSVAPSGNARTANFLYQVDNEVYTGTQPFFRLIMNRAEYDYLRNVWGAPNSDAAVNGAFISTDGLTDHGPATQARQLATFRNRGHGTRSAVPHNFRVDLAKDRPLQERQSINLNTQWTQSQVLGSALMRRARLPMAESRAARVRVNATDLANAGSPQFGSYAANEVVDGELVKRQIPNDDQGNLYRGIRDVYPGNPKADLAWHGPDFTSYTNAYFKQNNTTLNDWSDLIHLTDVLNNAPDAEYVSAVRSVVNVEQWMRFFALNTLLDNQETSISTGYGDDYALYCGVKDPRIILVGYDMDSILGNGARVTTFGDGLFRMIGVSGRQVPALERLMKHPEFAPEYFRQLKLLTDTILSPAQLNPLLDQLKASFAPGAAIDTFIANMKTFNVSHSAYVLAQIPLELTITSALEVQNGYPRTVDPGVSLTGKAHAFNTRKVVVNGQPADWSAWQTTWRATNVSLAPGINRVLVQALDATNREFERQTYDVWYDDGSVKNLTGTVAAGTFWKAVDGPYSLSGEVTIPSGATLTIEPGTTVYLGAGANLNIANGGRLLAEGTASAPIRFSRAPGGTGSWGGIVVNGGVGSPETRIRHAHFEFNGSTAIHSSGGTVLLDHLTFGATDHQYVSLDDSSFIVSDCIFPTATAGFELLHGTGGIKSGGHGLFIRNFFGATQGYNDVVDFTGGNRPGDAIVQFINNVFTGSSDDMIDLDGTDAWVEGNIFLHAHKNGSPDSSSAVSGGSDSGHTSEVTVIGNLFFDCDQAATAKQGNFFVLLNNTIVHQTKQGGLDTDAAVVNLADDGTTEGAGMYLEGNIIYDVEKLTRNLTAAKVTFTNNLLSLPWTGAGGGNSAADPLLTRVPKLAETFFNTWEHAQVIREWFALQPGSPAYGGGPNGSDQGGVVALGATLAGAPVGTNNLGAATLTVGTTRSGNGISLAGFPNGAGYTHYKWRLDGGPWSGETPVATPITLSELAPGPHWVDISGKRDSGWYQDDPQLGSDAVITTSGVWVTDPAHVPVPPAALILNEVLVKNLTTLTNGGAMPDLIELHNRSASAIDLAGLGLTDDASKPYKFKFPANAVLAAGGYLVLLADSETNSSGIHLGFSLKQEGDSVLLNDRAGGAGLLDSISFGLQIPDRSLGRRTDGSWGLCQPTFGGPNLALRTGDMTRLKINEWLANARFFSANDFVELFNPEPAPVALGGLFFTDAPGQPDRHQIQALSFIPAGGCAVFLADGDNNQANHLNFKLAAETGIIQLSTSSLVPIDTINYGPQRTDVSQGRTPSGAEAFAFFPQPSPGALNPGVSAAGTNVTTISQALLDFSATWKYSAEAIDPGAAWTTPGFDDQAWTTGQAPFGLEPSNPYPYPLPIKTALSLTTPARTRIKTYYFRTRFTVTNGLENLTLRATNYLDDGAVFHLNGSRVAALRVSENPATYTSDASSQPNEGQEETITLPADRLVIGENVLAVEVHQSGNSSTDVYFALALGASQSITNTIPTTGTPVLLNELLVRNQRLTNAAGRIQAWVELYNPSVNPVRLDDLSLTDDPALPRKWVFPPDQIVPAKGFHSVALDASPPPSVANTGFNLPATGGALYLFDGLATGGAVLDTLAFGLQTPDFALGRVPDGGADWMLTIPGENKANLAAGLGSPSALRLNEWMADPASGADWFEIFNGDAAPVSLGGLLFTDDLGNPTKSPIRPLSFIGTGRNAFVQFLADKDLSAGANHTDFKLGKGGSPLGLFAPSGLQLDALSFGPQATGVSEGRLPDGANTFAKFPGSPTPNAPNLANSGAFDTDGDGMPDSWEDLHGLNKLVNDAALDADGDGLTNLNEYLAGTDPRNPASSLTLAASADADGIVTLTFEGLPGRSYRIQLRDEISGGNWLTLGSVPPSPVAGRITMRDIPPANSTRFYRLATP